MADNEELTFYALHDAWWRWAREHFQARNSGAVMRRAREQGFKFAGTTWWHQTIKGEGIRPERTRYVGEDGRTLEQAKRTKTTDRRYLSKPAFDDITAQPSLTEER